MHLLLVCGLLVSSSGGSNMRALRCHSPPIIPGALDRSSSTSSSGSSPVIVVVTTPTTILVDCQFFRLLLVLVY